MDAFDADVLIYAAIPDHPLGPFIGQIEVTFPADLPDPAGEVTERG